MFRDIKNEYYEVAKQHNLNVTSDMNKWELRQLLIDNNILKLEHKSIN